MIAGKAIYYLHTNDGPISAIVDTRVFPEIADQEQTKPYVVYSIRSNDPSDVQAAPSALDTASVEVNCYALSYTAAIDLSDAVRTCLGHAWGVLPGRLPRQLQQCPAINPRCKPGKIPA